ncbi:DNA repair protein [Bacillus cereus]|nr:DNA repair protein [Bacillus cereus]
MNDVRGSLWRKWDLHVHTPESLVHQYNCAAEDDVWEKYISDLERLPPEIKVIGINDYIFLDGYIKVLEYKKNGRLQNIDLILPVIELRLNKFGGTKSHLSRVNYHIIFSNEIEPDIIQSQFLNALTSKYTLSHEHESMRWDGLITRNSLEKLGKQIKDSVPEEQRKYYDSDLIEGFNNLNLDIREISEVLSRTYFKNKYLTAVGKTEWADIKWSDHSIADKKTIINDCDFVFTSSESVEHFKKAKESLLKDNVNSRLLDCSDAHRFSDSENKDRLGKCFTWFKCDPTFDGLKQIRNEFDSRVFVGDMPFKLDKVCKNPTKYIHSIKIAKIEEAKHEGWFDSEIPLNHDLVAVIGNKGNGKSAIADIIGLMGNTKNHAEFSFLTKDKFRRNNLSTSFYGEMKWESDLLEKRNLSENPLQHEIEKVKYLPQQFIEKLCNLDDEKFEEELKEVIYSHVSEKDRLKQKTLNALISAKTSTFKKNIETLKIEVATINETIISTEKLCTSAHKKSASEQIKNKEEEIEVHLKIKPKEVEKAEGNPEVQGRISEVTKKISELNTNLQQITEFISEQSLKQIEVEEKLSYIQIIEGYITNFRKQYDAFVSSCEKEANALEIDIKSIISLTLTTDALQKSKEEFLSEKERLNNILINESEQNLYTKKNKVEEEIRELQAQLDEPQRKYQLYVKELADWTRKLDDLHKKLKILKEEKTEIEEKVVGKLQQLKENRELKLKEIHQNIMGIKAVYEELYNPVQTFISEHPLNDEKFQLNFEVSLETKGFTDKFLSFINQGVKGVFLGKEEGRKLLNELILKYDFNTSDSIVQFVNEIISSLSKKDETEPETYNIQSQLIKNVSLQEIYEHLYSLSYLQPTYSLRLGDKELKTLSPGEKGSLLLIFYLLVDNDDIPLIIDQPEENLDNQTVFNLLVPCIKEAKNRRQIIIITHNPNLAVVCDAEQIIHASMDKSNKNQIKYQSGSIENPVINSKIIDILEGTTPAFKNRESKYFI